MVSRLSSGGKAESVNGPHGELGFSRTDRALKIAIGPVTKNTVDAAISLAYKWNRPVMLIASRRQVECEELGPGYVERWTTQQFADYVRRRDRRGLVMLCRDHGGPWQHPSELTVGTNEDSVLSSCLLSLARDIDAGFEVLHLDTSASIGEAASLDRAIQRLTRLYKSAFGYAQQSGRYVSFEIGFEEQGTDVADPQRFQENLAGALEGLAAEGLPRPRFVVAQTGTKIVQARNIGVMNDPAACGRFMPRINRLVGVCHSFGTQLKAHNGDYLACRSLRLLSSAGVDAINVAPAFGVIETRELLRLLRLHGLNSSHDAFLVLAYGSGEWEKWMTGSDGGHGSTDYDRAVVAGHYVLAHDEFRPIKDRLTSVMRRKGRDLDELIKSKIMVELDRYCAALEGGAGRGLFDSGGVG